MLSSATSLGVIKQLKHHGRFARQRPVYLETNHPVHDNTGLMTPPPTPGTREKLKHESYISHTERKRAHKSRAERKKEKNRLKKIRKAAREEIRAAKHAATESYVVSTTKASYHQDNSIGMYAHEEAREAANDNERSPIPTLVPVNTLRPVLLPINHHMVRSSKVSQHSRESKHVSQLFSSNYNEGSFALAMNYLTLAGNQLSGAAKQLRMTAKQTNSRCTGQNLKRLASKQPPLAVLHQVCLAPANDLPPPLDVDDSEEEHEEELDRLVSLHLGQDHAEYCQTKDNQTEALQSLPISTNIHKNSQSSECRPALVDLHAPEDFADLEAAFTVNQAYHFLHQMQQEEHQLSHHIKHFEAQLQKLRKKVYNFNTSDLAQVKAYEEVLGLKTAHCLGLYLAAYAFRDILYENRQNEEFDFGAALEQLMGEVGSMVEEYEAEVRELESKVVCWEEEGGERRSKVVKRKRSVFRKGRCEDGDVEIAGGR
jgi:hypothetical protein